MSLGIQTQQVPNFSPQQMKLFRKLLGNINNGGGLEAGLGRLGRLAAGSQEGFEELEKPAYADFQKQLGQIGTRFSGLGAQGSSAFQNATSGAATDLTERLQAARMGIQNNALQALLGQSNQLLGQRPFNTVYQQPDQGFDWQSLLGQGISGISSILPFFL
jgi:hypothetical protein